MYWCDLKRNRFDSCNVCDTGSFVWCTGPSGGKKWISKWWIYDVCVRSDHGGNDRTGEWSDQCIAYSHRIWCLCVSSERRRAVHAGVVLSGGRDHLLCGDRNPDVFLKSRKAYWGRSEDDSAASEKSGVRSRRSVDRTSRKTSHGTGRGGAHGRRGENRRTQSIL